MLTMTNHADLVTSNLPELAGIIRREHRLAEQHAMQAVNHAMEAGRLLIEAKALCSHGKWLSWLADNFEGSARTAQAYMRLYENRDALANTQSSAHLSIDGALKLLAEPKEADPFKSWLPTDPNVLAKLIFSHLVPGVSDDDTEPEMEHPRLFVQRMGKDNPHWQYQEDKAWYFAVFMEGSQVQYTTRPQPGWMVAYSIGMFAGGRFAQNGKMVQALPLSHETDTALRAHANLGWEYSEESPNFVSAWVDILHPFNPMEH